MLHTVQTLNGDQHRCKLDVSLTLREHLPNILPVEAETTPNSSSDPITTMPSVLGFKIPTAWDSNRPKFDGETASSLKLFLRNTEQVCDSGGITSKQEQKKLLLNYLNDR
jgi:hypothetical protein